MKKLKKITLPFLVLVLVLSMVTMFRSFLMDELITPTVLLFWGGWRIIAGVDQVVYWIALIIFCAVLVAWLIISRKVESPNRIYNYSYKPPNRVEHWRTLIDEAILGNNEREQLRQNTKELFISVLAQDERAGTSQADEIRQKELTSLPPAAYQFLYPEGRENQKLSLHFLQNGFLFIPRWLRRWSKKNIRQNHMLIAEILRWMERELEIKDEK